MVGAVKRPILHYRTKFRKDRINCCGDIAIFVLFKMAAPDMKVLIFCAFGLKTPIHAQKIGILGEFDSLNRGQY